MLIEIFLSGMTFEQSLSSRLVAVPGEYLNCMAVRFLS
ncbi:L-alanine exporter AlaE [Leclercia adecarboxylata]|uniref:L-alanine exporter AlaE n=1 Tax=Leclercia adecarboxylata TaxID=83655 RepID=A0A4U9IGU0_9ENTR|nr:L-alanine exporter AlaE [Leclercia adecarboxylata]